METVFRKSDGYRKRGGEGPLEKTKQWILRQQEQNLEETQCWKPGRLDFMGESGQQYLKSQEEHRNTAFRSGDGRTWLPQR